MIIRIWRGWTRQANADAYERLLLARIFPGIAARKISGYLGIRLDRREAPDGVEFVTTMLFASMDAVVAFAGDEYRTSVVPPSARALLSRYDAEAAHYDLIAGEGALAPPGLPTPGAMQH